RLLRDAKLLPQVKRIGAVSGGSILAAHLVLNWERYTGDEAAFHSVAQEIIRFVQLDVRGRVVRRWLLAWLPLALPRLFIPKRWRPRPHFHPFYRRWQSLTKPWPAIRRTSPILITSATAGYTTIWASTG